MVRCCMQQDGEQEHDRIPQEAGLGWSRDATCGGPDAV